MSRHEHKEVMIPNPIGFDYVDIDVATQSTVFKLYKIDKELETIATLLTNANRYWHTAYCKPCVHKGVCRIELIVGQQCESFKKGKVGNE